MTPREFYRSKSTQEVREVAKSAGTSYDNFKQIVFGGSVGKSLAERLAIASDGEMTELEILYPDRYENSDNSAAA